MDENLPRKTFFKPLIFELRGKDRPYLSKGEAGEPLISMSRVLPNQNLEVELTNLLREKNIAPEFIRARISSHIEFDRDKEEILTPRVIVYVLVEKFNKKGPEQRRTWK